MKIFLLDTNGILCRYFFAMDELFTEDGIMVNGLFGYCRFVRDLIKQHKNEEFSIVAAFDKCSKNFRKEISIEYKSNRPKADTSLIVQLNLAEEFCKNIGIPVEYHLNYEADDIIASIAHSYQKDNEVFVVSSDKDFMQLVSDKIKILNPFTKTLIDTEFVQKKFGIPPDKFNLFLALCGDSADNISGIEGVGPKTATKILQQTDDPKQMQTLFPKFDFSKLELMLSLTTLSDEYQFNQIKPYSLDIAQFNNSVSKLNFKSIRF